MTIQKQQPTPQSHSNMEEALSGNHAAGELAQKAAALMEQLMGSTVTTKLSELPTRKERLLALADAIERQELVKKGIGFNMRRWYGGRADENRLRPKQGMEQHSCGTVAYIAGWTAILEGHPTDSPNASFSDTAIYNNAKKILNLSEEEGRRLFVPGEHYDVLHDAVTAELAVAVIRHFAETGSIAWNDFDSDGKRK